MPHYRSLYLTEKYAQDPTLLTRIRNIGTNFFYKRFLRRQLAEKNHQPPAKKNNGFNLLYAGGREYIHLIVPKEVLFTVLENVLHTLFDTLYLPLFHSTLSHPMPMINSLFFLYKNWRVSCRLPIGQGLLSTNKECLNSRLFRMSLGSRTFPPLWDYTPLRRAGEVTRPFGRCPSKAYAATELVCGIYNTSPSYRNDTLKISKLMTSVWITVLNSSPCRGLPAHIQFYDNNSWFQHRK